MQPFLIDELIIFIKRETGTSVVDFNISAGISQNGVALEPSSFEFFFLNLSSVIS